MDIRRGCRLDESSATFDLSVSDAVAADVGVAGDWLETTSSSSISADMLCS
jgi:hypothetical protein